MTGFTGKTMTALAILGLAAGCGQNGGKGSANGPAGSAVNASAGPPSSFPQIYERVSPAVVSINAAHVATSTSPVTDYFSGSLGGGQPRIESMSSGSGFFISSDGRILTNDHVVGSANQVTVVLRDGRELPARVVGRDPASDLAVLKVAGRDYPHVTFAAAVEPTVGEEVIAIGNPFGLGTTATHGIVSAAGRNIGSPYVDFVQLDAPINQGNSGGPTFNVRGEVIGVNTAIFSPTGGSVGVGFAIPASTASAVARELAETGRVERGFIGASLADLRPRAGGSATSTRSGAVVAAIVMGAPAQRAGLRPGDVITAAEGKEISGAADVIRTVVRAKAGTVLRLSVTRDGRAMSIEVPVGRRN